MLQAMTTAHIALGSNLGKRQAALRAALARIAALPGTRVVAVATFRETPPIDAPPGSGAFINSAAGIETSLSAPELLRNLLEIEQALGRDRTSPAVNAPRIIDLDLLLYGTETVHAAGLEVPHPRMHLRSFVLEPLAEIAPDVLHPSTGKTIRELFAELQGQPAGKAT
jgi:2-amino-4-hydroxy-6-hydroxymethyldihydropteridine diphosphokinase